MTMLIKLGSEIHWEAKEQRDLSGQAVSGEQLLFIIKWWKVKSRSLLSKGQQSLYSKNRMKGMAFYPLFKLLNGLKAPCEFFRV